LTASRTGYIVALVLPTRRVAPCVRAHSGQVRQRTDRTMIAVRHAGS
jgi:hypothetical protein